MIKNKLIVDCDKVVLLFPLALLIIGNMMQETDLIIWALIIQILFLIGLCINSFYRKVALAFFYVCIFTFLTGGILIEYFRQGDSWMRGFTVKEYITACNILYLTYLFLWLGYNWRIRFSFSQYKTSGLRKFGNKVFDRNFDRRLIQVVSFWMLFGSTLPLAAFNIIKLRYAMAYGYMSLYTTYADPGWSFRLLYVNQVSLFISLAAKPPKWRMYACFALGLINPAIEFMQGARGAIVTQMLFIVFYLYIYEDMRELNVSEAKHKRKFRCLAILAVIIGAIGLPLLNIYGITRAGIEYTGASSGVEGMIGFFEQQGFSFSLIGYAVRYKGKLPQILYSVGGMFDLFVKPEGFGGLEDIALKSHSFGNAITYITSKDAYFNGFGMGSSYVAEIFYDFGYVGVVVVNFFLGRFFNYMMDWKKRGILGYAACFFLYRYFLGMPRGAFAEPFQRLMAKTTILIFLIIFGLSYSYQAKMES